MSDELDKKAIQLTDDAVEKAAGGANDDTKTWTLRCSACGREYTVEMDTLSPCPDCRNGKGRPIYT